MDEPRRRNPFQNEADAFRILVMVVVAAAIVIAATVVIAPWLGAALGAIAFLLACWSVLGWLRVELSEPDDTA